MRDDFDRLVATLLLAPFTFVAAALALPSVNETNWVVALAVVIGVYNLGCKMLERD